MDLYKEYELIAWTNDTASLEMVYDSIGRRIEKKLFLNDQLITSDKFIYDGYLQIATLDAMNSNAVSRLIYWDPAEPVATRPLMVSLANSGTFFPTVDLTKYVCELIDVNLDIATTYDYAPFGSTSISGTYSTPFQFSSEFSDSELGLVYYNYRHYNPTDGRWLRSDQIEEEGGVNLYGFMKSNVYISNDHLGLCSLYDCFDTCVENNPIDGFSDVIRLGICKANCNMYFKKFEKWI